jgi:urease accessory protein
VKRGYLVKRASEWTAGEAVDRVVLDAEDRHRRRAVLIGERGTRFLLDLASPAALHDGDGLVLDDGSIVAVRGACEPLTEVAAGTTRELLRFAWHIGNRHAGLQVDGQKLRIRRDHVLEDMLRQMGAVLTPVEAPFDPEPGGHSDHGHEHGG